MEDWFVSGEEIVVGDTFAELSTLLVHGEVHDRSESVENVQTVLEPGFHAVPCGGFLHPCEVFD